MDNSSNIIDTEAHQLIFPQAFSRDMKDIDMFHLRRMNILVFPLNKYFFIEKASFWNFPGLSADLFYAFCDLLLNSDKLQLFFGLAKKME